MNDIVTSSPKVMHGTSCFAGTRVPVKLLLDNLDALNEEDLRAVQFPAYFLCAVSKLASEVAQKINVIALSDMPIPVVDQHLVMGLNIRKGSFGISIFAWEKCVSEMNHVLFILKSFDPCGIAPAQARP